MPLMDRIKLLDWTQRSWDNKLKQITQLQALRAEENELARLRGGGRTRTATKRLAAKGKDPAKAATAALDKLSPSQLAAILKKLT